MNKIQFSTSAVEADLRIQTGNSLLLLPEKPATLRIPKEITNFQELGAKAGYLLKNGRWPHVVLDCNQLRGEDLSRFILGFLLPLWQFEKYKSSPKPFPIDTLTVVCEEPKKEEAHFNRYRALLSGVYLARDLISEPPNVMYPEAVAREIKSLESFGLQVEILHYTDLVQEGLGALLAVGQGSAHPPCLAIIQWKGSKEAPIVVAGKGVCFDSGGVSIKAALNLHEMKWDKAGAGAVVGLLRTAAERQIPRHLVGIVGLVENMPDGKAQKPGDVIKSYSGITIEVIDTDAEGRLVLADCLAYGKKRFQPSCMVDLGTLTLEIIGALGSEYAGLYTNNSALSAELVEAGQKSGEKVWPMPHGGTFAKQIESSIADIKNLGLEWRGECGAAAEFLSRFVGDVPWAHLDIAGVAWSREDLPFSSHGVTGYGVRLLEEWLVSKDDNPHVY